VGSFRLPRTAPSSAVFRSHTAHWQSLLSRASPLAGAPSWASLAPARIHPRARTAMLRRKQRVVFSSRSPYTSKVISQPRWRTSFRQILPHSQPRSRGRPPSETLFNQVPDPTAPPSAGPWLASCPNESPYYQQLARLSSLERIHTS